MTIVPPPIKTATSLHERRRSRPSVGFVAVLLIGWLASGCRSQTGPTTREQDVEADSMAVSGASWKGRVRVEGGAVTLTVTEGDARGGECVVLARADLAPPAGEEALWRCADPIEPTDTAVLALTSGDELLWTTQEFLRGEVCIPSSLAVSVVDALPGAPRELLVRVIACGSTAQTMDEDVVLAWGENGMRPVAKVTMSCTLARDTSDSPEAAVDERAWICSGGYLEMGGEPDAPLVVQVDVAPVYAHAERDADQRLQWSGRVLEDEPAPSDYVQRHTLLWDPVAQRYGDGASTPEPPVIPVQQTHYGTLTPSDTQNSTDSSYQDDYTIEVKQGWVITAELSAPAFQPYVWILAPEQANAQQLGSQPGVHEVTLTHVAEQSGVYTVRANSNVAAEVGDYTLRITAGPAPSP